MEPAREASRPDSAARSIGIGESSFLVLRNPVIVFLTLAGIFDGLSGNPIHSILLFSAAAALGWDEIHARRAGSTEGWRQRPRPVVAELGALSTLGWFLLPVAILYALVVGGFGRYSWPATALVVVPAGIGVALAWRGPLIGGPEPARIGPVGGVAWASVFVGLSLWELTQLLLQPSLTTDSQAHPTLSVLSDPILSSHPGRSIMLILWLAFGWFLALR